MDIKSAYTEWAPTYDEDRNLTRDLDAAITRKNLTGQRVGRLLEIGCGTGKNTEFFVTWADAVLAVDFSEGMLERARQKVNSPRVEWRQADITRPWPVEDGVMDWVSIHLVLEHIDDLAVIFAEAARALRSGGQLYVSEFHPFRQYLGGKARMERGGNLIEIDSFIHHVSDFYREAGKVGLICHDLSEHLHPEEDPTKTPRLLVLRFQK